MTRLTVLAALALTAGSAFAEPAELAPAPRPAVDLAGYRTTATALRANPKEFVAAATPAAAGFFGVSVAELGSKVFVEDVAPGSPADKAGVRAGDVIRTLNGEPIATAAAARDALRARLAGDRLTLAADRDGRKHEFSALLVPASRPLSTENAARPILDIQLVTGNTSGGARVQSVGAGGPADKAGVKAGDVIVKVNDAAVMAGAGLREALADKRPGDRITLAVERDGKSLELVATLAGDEPARPGRGGAGAGAATWDDRVPRAWRRPDYKLAVIGVEYPDVKHNPKVTAADWEASLFSRHQYTGKSATGQAVYGSMADYYAELSHDTFRPDGKFVGWVEVSKKRAEYSSGSGTSSREKTALLAEAMDKLVAKNKDALKDFDGVFFLYAGDRVQTTRGGLYWPHRATLTHGGKRWPYFIVQEGGGRMTDISVFCHEFGHMLGLPDLYARPENPGSEGVGVWCAMANQVGEGKPQHMCAWSKEQLGWVKPVVIDPRVKQKLILSPVEDAATECYKVMVRADGSEYFLLENRRKQGWDKSLPAEGLLIWRVVNGRPMLEESHGVEGAAGPRVHLGSVPFPSAANDSFTPFTTPSSRSQLGGGLPVYITSIRKLPDGRVALHVGYEYQ